VPHEQADNYDEDFSDSADADAALQLPQQLAVAEATIAVAVAVKAQQPPVLVEANYQTDDAVRRDTLGLSDNDVHDEEEVLDESLEDFR
jgi:hypothetical protein